MEYSWEKLRKEITSQPPLDEQGNTRLVLWRGQRDTSWNLASAFERLAAKRLEDSPDETKEKKRLSALKNKLYQEFKLRIVGSTSVRVRELAGQPQQLWAIGRHFGLLTPLLDWTESSYIGLFFAIRDLLDHRKEPSGKIVLQQDDEVALYKLVQSEDLTDGTLKIERSRIEGLSRLTAQKGAFTFLDDDTFRYLSIEAFLDEKGKKACLTKYVLHGDDEIKAALAEINAAGIDARMLLPDEHGAAQAVNVLAENLV